VHWSPYFAHIKDGWSHRHDENVLFLFYEDLTADLEGSLRKLSQFLGKPLKDDDLPKLLDHLHIKNFKHNPAVNGKDLIDVKVLVEGAQGFVRLGDAGKNVELTSEMTQRLDEWIEENLKDSDFRFPA
jgi:sulfotransferase